MSDWDDDDDEFSGDSDLVKQLRKQLKEAKKANSELDTELSALRPQVRKNSMTQILSGLGINPKVAAIMPESIDPNKDAVQSWLDDYGDLFNLKPADSPAPPDDKKEEGSVVDAGNAPAPGIPPGMAEAWTRMQGGDTTTGAVAPDMEKVQQSQLADAAQKSGGSFDRFVSLLQNNPLTPM